MYWHVLLGNQLRPVATRAQAKLADFPHLHLTPPEWLHMTTLVAGPAEEISADQLTQLASVAIPRLSRLSPIHVSVEQVIHHPEAVALRVRPRRALLPILDVVHAATSSVMGSGDELNTVADDWTPHVTLAYSTAEQPAEPIIAALGRTVPRCDFSVDAISLVVQWGPEQLWGWEVVESLPFGLQP